MQAIFECIVCFFAIYGFMKGTIELIAYIYSKVHVDGRVKIVLLVRDAENIIEGIVRSAFSTHGCKKLTIVDMDEYNSNTEKIIQRLNCDVGNVEYYRKEEKEKIFEDF